MRLLLLTARPELETNRRLIAAAEGRGVEAVAVDLSTVSAVAGSGGFRVLGTDGAQLQADVVIARVGNWRPESSLAVLEALVMRGVPTPNPPAAIRAGRDHWSTIRLLASAGLAVPETVAGSDPETLAAAAAAMGLPVVVKQRRSRMGVGVIRCAERDHLEGVLDSLWRLGDEVIVQRWLPEGRRTVRALVVGGRVVAAARFSAAAGEWRSNTARGGSAEAYRASAEEAAAAVAAAAALGLGYCGVDLAAGADGPVVLEVNPTPGFVRLERATGIDVAGAVVGAAVELARR